MNPAQVKGIVRSIVIAISGVATAAGYLQDVDWVAIAGGLAALAGLISSILSNGLQATLKDVAESSEVKKVVVDTHALADSVPSAKVVAG